MIEVDGIYYSADEVEEAIRDRKRLQIEVKKLLGPFTCHHEPQYAGGACAACHALWMDKADKTSADLDVAHQQFATLLGEAMRRMCPTAGKCDGKCVGAAFGKWAIRELVPSNFKGKIDSACPECKGGSELAWMGGTCLMCGGSGDLSGPRKISERKCSKCGRADGSVTRAVFLQKAEWPYLCHKCDRK